MKLNEYEKEYERIRKYQQIQNSIEMCEESIEKLNGFDCEIKFYTNKLDGSRTVDLINGFETSDYEELRKIVLEMLYKKKEKLNVDLEEI